MIITGCCYRDAPMMVRYESGDPGAGPRLEVKNE